MKVYAIRDIKAGSFVGSLSLFPADGVAVRSFALARADSGLLDLVRRAPSDFELWRLADFDDSSTSVDVLKSAPELVRLFSEIYPETNNG